MYENHNHAYDEIHQVRHDQNKEKETITIKRKLDFLENSVLFFFELDVLLEDYLQKNPKPYLDLLNVFRDYVFGNE